MPPTVTAATVTCAPASTRSLPPFEISKVVAGNVLPALASTANIAPLPSTTTFARLGNDTFSLTRTTPFDTQMPPVVGCAAFFRTISVSAFAGAHTSPAFPLNEPVKDIGLIVLVPPRNARL